MQGWVALTDGVLESSRFSNSQLKMYLFDYDLDRDLLDLKRMEFRIKDSDGGSDWICQASGIRTPQVSMMWNSPTI